MLAQPKDANHTRVCIGWDSDWHNAQYIILPVRKWQWNHQTSENSQLADEVKQV